MHQMGPVLRVHRKISRDPVSPSFRWAQTSRVHRKISRDPMSLKPTSRQRKPLGGLTLGKATQEGLISQGKLLRAFLGMPYIRPVVLGLHWRPQGRIPPLLKRPLHLKNFERR